MVFVEIFLTFPLGRDIVNFFKSLKTNDLFIFDIKITGCSWIFWVFLKNFYKTIFIRQIFIRQIFIRQIFIRQILVVLEIFLTFPRGRNSRKFFKRVKTNDLFIFDVKISGCSWIFWVFLKNFYKTIFIRQIFIRQIFIRQILVFVKIFLTFLRGRDIGNFFNKGKTYDLFIFDVKIIGCSWIFWVFFEKFL